MFNLLENYQLLKLILVFLLYADFKNIFMWNFQVVFLLYSTI